MKRILILSFSVLIAACLAGVAVAVARPQWMPAWARINPEKLPTWARFGGQTPAAEDAGLYCKEHGVPEKFCTLCHEELADKLMLCKEHGNIPEDICTLCHPEVAKKYNIEMCKEHGLPEHFCFKCGKGPSASLDQPDDGWCAAHNKPEALCPECAQARAKGQPLPTVKTGTAKVCREPLPTVRLASAKLARKIGIQTAVVTEEEHAHRLIANAETAYDANHYAEISPRVAGFIREVRVDLGQAVRQGDVLAVVDSAEVSAAKTQYLSSQASLKLAQATADRTQSLSRSGAVAGKAELEVMTALNQAQASVDGRRAEAAEPRLRRRRAGPDPQDQGHEEPAERRRPDRRDGGGEARGQGRGGPGDGPALRRRRHVPDVALDRRLRERHRQGEARPGGELHRLGDRPRARVCDRRAGDLGRHRGQRADPHHPRPGRARQPERPAPRQPVRRGRRFRSAPSTRPWSSPRRPCSGRTTWMSSSSPKAKASTARSGSRPSRPTGATCSR